MKILITGGTGFIGQVLVSKILQERVDTIHILTRNLPRAQKIFGPQMATYNERLCLFAWDPANTWPPADSLHQVDAVINLLGEGVANHRWSAQQKSKIYYSRILGTKNLVAALNQMAQMPQVLISTSAVGFYRQSQGPEDFITENSEPGAGLLTQTCIDWEAEALRVKCRCCILRVGGPLGVSGGILGKMLPAFRWGLGGKLGSGEQYFSWIHVRDLAAIYLAAIDNQHWQGIYNATAPHPVTNAQFTQVLGKVLQRPIFFSLPRPLLETVVGEMISMAFYSQVVLPHRLLQEHFCFMYPTLDSALNDLLGKSEGDK